MTLKTNRGLGSIITWTKPCAVGIFLGRKDWWTQYLWSNATKRCIGLFSTWQTGWKASRCYEIACLRIPFESIVGVLAPKALILLHLSLQGYAVSIWRKWWFPGYGFGVRKGFTIRNYKEAIEHKGSVPLHRRALSLLNLLCVGLNLSRNLSYLYMGWIDLFYDWNLIEVSVPIVVLVFYSYYRINCI